MHLAPGLKAMSAAMKTAFSALVLAATGCASSANGVRPCDMSADAHIAAARVERSEAKIHRAKASRYGDDAGKQNLFLYRRYLEHAQEHERAAAEHTLAATQRAAYSDSACRKELEPVWSGW
jgi:hypothetical protein